MNLSRPEITELLDLVTALLDGEIDDDALDRLNTLLRDDPDARRLYCQLIDLHDELPATLTDQRTARDLATDARGLQSVGSSALGAAATTPTARRRSRRRKRPSAFLHHLRPWALAAAVVLAIPTFASFAYHFRIPWFGFGAESRPADLDRVAVLFETSDYVEFTYDGPNDHDPQLIQGETIYPGVIDLEYGWMNITFECGAEVRLEAPARFFLNHPKRAYLERGKLTAYCPERARGFTVGAPGVAVIDLGTRFWMTVDDLGVTDVAVTEGRVDVQRDNGETVALLRGSHVRASRVSFDPIRIVAQAPPTPQEDDRPVQRTPVRHELLRADAHTFILDDFSTERYAEGSNYGDIGWGWYGKGQADDDTAYWHWQIIDGRLRQVGSSGSKTRVGCTLRIDALTGTGWRLEYDIEGGAERIELWLGRDDRGSFPEHSVWSTTGEAPPNDAIVDFSPAPLNTWRLAAEQTHFDGASVSIDLAGIDLSDYDLAVLRIISGSGGVERFSIDNIVLTSARADSTEQSDPEGLSERRSDDRP